MDKKFQAFFMLVLTGTSVLVILLQYVVPALLESRIKRKGVSAAFVDQTKRLSKTR